MPKHHIDKNYLRLVIHQLEKEVQFLGSVVAFYAPDEPDYDNFLFDFENKGKKLSTMIRLQERIKNET